MAAAKTLTTQIAALADSLSDIAVELDGAETIDAVHLRWPQDIERELRELAGTRKAPQQGEAPAVNAADIETWADAAARRAENIDKAVERIENANRVVELCAIACRERSRRRTAGDKGDAWPRRRGRAVGCARRTRRAAA